MRATFVLSGVEGGKYTLQFELSSIPRQGDHVFILMPEQTGPEEFVVQRTSWHLHHPDAPDSPETVGKIREITVECQKAEAWAPAWTH